MGVWALLLAFLGLAATDPYVASVEEWRRSREARLKADDGWLTVVGLFWLKEGENRFGTDPSNDIVLPEGSAAPRVGVFELRGGHTTLRYDADPGQVIELRSDAQGSPDVIRLGDLSLFVMEGGERYAIRLRDKNSRFRNEFSHLEWYPVRPEYRISARFIAHASPKTLSVPTIVGYSETRTSPGYVEFELDGSEYRLEPVSAGSQLFFIFRDLTSGKTTYGAGRFLYAEMPKDGKVELDFNKAYNPPCAFTPYTVCPLPPPQNRLAVPIEAGELDYHH